MRKVLIGLMATVTTLVVVAVGADFGGAIYAEYRWARSVRSANGLGFDPWVGILGFPFSTQAVNRRYKEVEIRAGGVDHPVVGKVSLEATMHSVDLSQTSWLAEPDAKLPIRRLERRIIIDSTSAGFDEKVSVSVDLSIVGEEQTTLVTTATGVLTGAGTADQEVPEQKRAAVLAAFSISIPGQKLPFGLKPTSEGARGSDLIIEGITTGVTVALSGFKQS